MVSLREVLKDIPAGSQAERDAYAMPGADPGCKSCEGRGWYYLLDEQGQQVKNAFGGYAVEHCACMAEAEARLEAIERADHTNTLLAGSGLGALSRLSFDSYEAVTTSQFQALEAAMQLASGRGGNQKWLYLYGDTGVGKTHLAAAAVRGACERGRHARFFRVPRWLMNLRATFNGGDGNFQEIFDDACESPLLVLDDLGAESVTRWSTSIVEELIKHRHDQQLPTLITSNLDFGVVDGPLASRIVDVRLTRVVRVLGQDYRRGGRRRFLLRQLPSLSALRRTPKRPILTMVWLPI